MSQVLTCPNCGATAEIGEGIESGQFVCAKCRSTVGFGPGATMVLERTEVNDDMVGKTLAGYEVKSLLGAGGMGKVYLARQISIDRPVALKILAARLAENDNFTKRFIREAQAAGRLLHPNLVTVFDAGKEGNTYFFSMEYVKGEPASKLIFETGKVAPVEALRIVRQVAEALRCAFEQGIIHRDIKPDNIMITPSGLVKLADLGLAKHIEGEAGESGLTVAGAVMGTPHYLAPEQARNSKDVDQRADIYSLGCTLYHMLTGCVPFSGSSTYEILRKHEIEEPEFPEDSGIPEQVCRLVCSMMAKDPEDRPQTPSEVLSAIDQILGTPSTAAGGTAPLTAGGLQTPTGAMRTPTPVEPGSGAATQPAEPARKKKRLRWILAAVIVVLILFMIASSAKDRESARRFDEARQYAENNPADIQGTLRQYYDFAGDYKGTKWANKAHEAIFAAVQAYAGEHPEDTENTLAMYNDVVTRLEGTTWATKAKQAILDIGYSQLEEALEKGPGKLDKLLEQLKEIKEATPDEEFAGSVDTWIERLKDARDKGVELEFRRFKEDVEKLFREGKWGEALVRVEKYPGEKGLVRIPAPIQKFMERTLAMAEIERTAKGFYNAAFKKDWLAVAKFIDPEQVKQDDKLQGLQLAGNIALAWTRARDYRVDRIEVSLPDNKAQIHGTVKRRGIGGRTEDTDMPVSNNAIRRNGKWYIRLDPKPEREHRDPENTTPRHPRRPRRTDSK